MKRFLSVFIVVLTLTLVFSLTSCFDGGTTTTTTTNQEKPDDPSVHIHDYKAVVTTPTCTEQGYTTYTCECGDSYVDDYVDAIGHNFGGWITVKEPNDIEEGLKERTCECGEKEFQSIDKLVASENLEFTLNDDGKSYSVTGIGTCTDTDMIIPSMHNGLPVTQISTYAFANCTQLTSVVIPDSVTEIGGSAFEGCNSLEKMVLPFIGRDIDADYESPKQYRHYFYGALGYIFSSDYYAMQENSTVPETLRQIIVTKDTTIGDRAFYDCEFIETISLPDGVTSIGEIAFRDCTSLISIDGGFDRLQTIGYYAFANCTSLERIGDVEKILHIPNTVTTLGSSAFSNCTQLKTLTIDMVGDIGTGAFEGCTGLTDINISGTVKTIGEYAFDNCTSAKYITIAEGVTSIGYCTFKNCAIKEIIVPDSVTEIGEYAFDGCNSLEKMTLPFIGRDINADEEYEYSPRYYGSLGYIFCGVPAYHNANTSIPETLRQVIITKDTTIGDHAFYNCDFIETILLPDGVISIGDEAFGNCTSLERIGNEAKVINIPETVIYLGYGAFRNCPKFDTLIIDMSGVIRSSFYDCTGLTNVVISGVITNIGDYAFENCTSLKSIEGDLNQLKYIGRYAFSNCSSLERIGDEAKIINIPKTVTNLGIKAFENCEKFETLIINMVGEIPSSAFKGCTGLTNITISDTVTSIGSYAFENCAISEITIPDSVINMGESIFVGCNALEKLTLPFIGSDIDAVRSEYISFTGFKFYCSLGYLFGSYIGGGTSLNSTVPQTLCQVNITKDTAIGENTFSSCGFIETISLPDGVTSIGENAFRDCTSLISIDGGFDRLQTIGYCAFANCTSLERIGDVEKILHIPNTVTTLDSSAFSNCTQLKTLTIDMVGDIGTGAFEGCTGLTDINISGTVTNIGSSAFEGCTSAKYITIADGVTSIGSWAFQNCAFVEIVVPNSVTNIGEYAFRGCNSLEKMVLPFLGKNIDAEYEFPNGHRVYTGSLGYIFGSSSYLYGTYVNDVVPKTLRQVIVAMDTTIGDHAFRNCDFIETIVLPDGVVSIGDAAFENCSELTNLYFGGTKTEWNNIEFGDNWDTDANSYYVHYNAFEYGIYLPTGAVRLENSERVYVLWPLSATAEIQVLNIKTGELMSINDTDIEVDIVSGKNRVSIGSGYLTGSQGGQGNMLAFYVSNGQTIRLEDTMPIFVAESTDYQIIKDSIRFSTSDREHIRMYLDMYHTLYTMHNVDDMTNINMNIVENLLYGISNLDDYLAGLIDQDLPKTVALKKALSEFISDYVDTNYAHLMAVEDTNTFLIGLEAIHELNGDYKKLTKLPNKVVKLIEKIDELYIMALLEGLTKDQLITLSNSLNLLIGYDEAMAEVMQTDVWKYGLSAYNQDYKNYVSAIKRVNSNTNLLDSLMDSGDVVILIRDNAPDKFEIGTIVIDFLIYGITDYSYNIELLQTIRDKMVSGNGGYSEGDAEVNAIDELILEYKYKWFEGVSDMLTNFATSTIMTIASKHPAVALVRVASDLAMMITPIDEKAEYLALSCYLDALKQCTYPIKDLYVNGKMVGDDDELKLFASLYINILLKASNLAYDIARYSPTDNAGKLILIEGNISALNNILSLYFK